MKTITLTMTEHQLVQLRDRLKVADMPLESWVPPIVVSDTDELPQAVRGEGDA
jgi:hypothetical protein